MAPLNHFGRLCTCISSEADNDVIMVEMDIAASEEMGEISVCAEIVDVTEIELGFTGQFEIIDMTAGESLCPVY